MDRRSQKSKLMRDKEKQKSKFKTPVALIAMLWNCRRSHGERNKTTRNKKQKGANITSSYAQKRKPN